MAKAVLDLDKRPVYTPVITTFEKTKTAEGFKLGSAVLRRHFSIIDAEIYFGNEFVEEVTGISWAISQNTHPLFGFNSYTYDEVARGSRLISGQFSINFVSPNYLFKILETAKEETISNLASYTIPVSERSVKDGLVGGVETQWDGTIQGTKHTPIWPETFDIDMILGQTNQTGDPVHIVLTDVVIQSCQSMLGSGNGSVMEVYNFLAKDIKTID